MSGRIFLLPLTTRQALVYCQRIASQTTKKLSISERISKKAADTWAKWEDAEKGWQKTLVTYGNRGLQRIPYQEWGLKSFPPSNPNIQAKEVTDDKKYDVIYPGNIMKQDDVPKVLQRLASERKQLHWKRFVGSMVALPFTIPFAIIPVIPNIPFFYVAYRCWSHWRALKGSDHLDFILDHRLFRPVSTPEVEQIYRRVAPELQNSFVFVTPSQIEDGTAGDEKVLLPSGVHTKVAKRLEVPELTGEVERAIWQVEQQLQKTAATSQNLNEKSVMKPAASQTNESAKDREKK